MQDLNSDGQPDGISFETDDKGNSFLHLVLPAESVNFLNGVDSDPSSYFNVNSGSYSSEGNSQFGSKMLVEVGCKVYEVNKVQYRAGNADYNRQNSSILDSLNLSNSPIILQSNL